MGLKPNKGLGELVENLRLAKSNTARSYLSLLREALALRMGETKNGFSEYFNYRLYDRNFVSEENCGTFLNSGFSHQIWEELNPTMWSGIAVDKVFFQLILEKLGFPQPELVAFYDSKQRTVPGIINLHSISDVKNFLLKTDKFPLFAKPIDSYRSRGAMGISSIDKSGLITFSNGDSRPIAEVLKDISNFENYVFQKKVFPATGLEDICGESLPTLRMIVLVTSAGPRLFRVVWKIPTKDNMADNFWRAGNMVAHVNPETGAVLNVIQSTKHGHVEIDESHAMGKRLLDSTTPNFDKAAALVTNLAQAFPMFRFQAWDIALTSDGPMAIELNHNGDLELLQVGSHIGLLDDTFRRVLEEYEIKLEVPRTFKQWSEK